MGAAAQPRLHVLEEGLEHLVARFVSDSPRRDSGIFSPPDAREQAVLLDAWQRLGRGEVDQAAALLAPIGMQAARLTDRTSRTASRHLLMYEPGAASGGPTRGFGLYVQRADAADGAAHLQVPHPRDDLHTERIGARAYLAAGARSLAVAGASRNATPGGGSDAAHARNTLFHAISTAHATPGARLVQLHGFRQDTRARSYGEAIVSTGERPTDQARAMHRALRDGGIDAQLYTGSSDFADLAARQNVQGIDARARGASFVHVELGGSVRFPDDRRAQAVDALADGIARGAR